MPNLELLADLMVWALVGLVFWLAVSGWD